MRKQLNQLLLAAALILPVFGVGCGEHRQVYVWGPSESTYYVQWEHETRRDHVEWERRNKAEQKEYWNWRHHHHD